MFYVDAKKPFTGCYATVWKVEEKDGFVKGRISTSRKKQDDTYVNSNWFVNFGKGISEKALKLKERDRIFIDTVAFENIYSEKNAQSYLSVTIHHFVMSDDAKNGATTSASTGTTFPKPKPPIEEIKEEESSLPFDL